MENIMIDKAGRIVIPKKIRKQFKSNMFQIRSDKKEITLKPVEGFASLFGKYPQLNAKEFYKERKAEIKRENIS